MTDTEVLNRLNHLYKNCDADGCDSQCEKCSEAINCVKELLKLRRELKFVLGKCDCIEDIGGKK